MLVWTLWGLPIALTMAAVAFSLIPLNSNLELEGEAPSWAKALALASLTIFVSFYAIALGNIPWMANELLALEVRALGTSLLTMVCCTLCRIYCSLPGMCQATNIRLVFRGLQHHCVGDFSLAGRQCYCCRGIRVLRRAVLCGLASCVIHLS